MSDDKKPSPPADKLTRVPVRHVYFHDNITFAGIGSGYSSISNQKCYPEPPSATTFVMCDFIPAWQMFEFTFHSGGRDAPKVRYVTSRRVSNWEREDAPR